MGMWLLGGHATAGTDSIKVITKALHDVKMLSVVSMHLQLIQYTVEQTLTALDLDTMLHRVSSLPIL